MDASGHNTSSQRRLLEHTSRTPRRWKTPTWITRVTLFLLGGLVGGHRGRQKLEGQRYTPWSMALMFGLLKGYGSKCENELVSREMTPAQMGGTKWNMQNTCPHCGPTCLPSSNWCRVPDHPTPVSLPGLVSMTGVGSPTPHVWSHFGITL